MRNRGLAVVVVIAVLVAVSLWLLDADEPTPVAPVEAAQPVPTSVVEDVPDASTVALQLTPDAGRSPSPREPSARPLVSSYYLGKGNTIADIVRPKTEFLTVCAREAEVCWRRFEGRDVDGMQVLVTLAGETSNRRVVGYSPAMEVMGGPTPFSDCVLAGLSTHTFITTEGGDYACSLADVRSIADPIGDLARAAAKCVGPDSKAEVVTIARSASNEVTISAINRLDLSAESCIRQAAQSWPDDTTARTLQLVLAGDIGGPIPEEDADRLSLTERRTTPLVTASEAVLAESAARRKLAEEALKAGNAKEAVRLLRECLTADPDNVDCLRASALTWLEYLRHSPGMTSVAAAKIWVRFATEMPPDDPDMPKVSAALARMGVHLR